MPFTIHTLHKNLEYSLKYCVQEKHFIKEEREHFPTPWMPEEISRKFSKIQSGLVKTSCMFGF